MPQTPRAYAEAQTGVLIQVPAGTVIGARQKTGDDGLTSWENIVTPTAVLLEIRIQAGELESLAQRAARSKGRKARQGPITLKVVRK